MFTRKHFVMIAAVIAKIENPTNKMEVYEEFVKLFKSSNPLFDSSKFSTACGVK